MSFGIPVRNGLSIGLLASTFLTSRSGRLVPRLTLNFLTGAPLDSRITFSRTTNATLVDSTGRVTYAPNNLSLYSEQFDNAVYIKVRSSITSNATTSPDGTATADKLVEDTTATSTHLIQLQAGFSSFVSGNTYVISGYAKAGERTSASISMGTDGGVFAGQSANFNFSTGVISAQSGVATFAMTDAGNGWYRWSIAVTAAASGSGIIRFSLIGPTGSNSYTGDGTSGLFLWGNQIEAVTYQTLPSTYVQTVASAYYGPRFDYDPVTLAARGLLIEEQRVNLALYSEQFDNAGWLKTNTTVTANAATSPDGTLNADKLIGTTTAAGHLCVQNVVALATLGTNYTFSVYLKSAEYGFAFIGLTGTAFVAVPYISVNLSTGAVATTNGSPVSSSAASSGNGWFRVTITGTTDVPAGAVSVDVRPSPDGVWANRNAAQSGTSGVFVWGAQAEAGAFATSYIPTVASTVTRAADDATMTGTNFSSWYNQSEGTIIAQFVATTNGFNSTGGNAFLFVYDIDSAAATNSGHSLLLSGGYGPGWRGSTSILGVDQAAFQAAMTLGNTTVRKIAYAYRTNDFAASANGGAATTDTSGNLPTNDRMTIGAQNATAGSNTITGYMQRITYYPTRLTDAQLQALTS